jgi:hypothetical protein
VKRFLTTTALAGLAAATFVAAGAATATKSIAFTGKYGGQAVTKQTDNNVDINATGVGTANVIGVGKVTGTGTADAGQRPCVPFLGTGSITGKKGSMTFKVVPGSTGCGDEGGQVFSITGHATVLKGLGALKGAKGTLKFTGTYDRGAGTFDVKFFGTLKA